MKNSYYFIINKNIYKHRVVNKCMKNNYINPQNLKTLRVNVFKVGVLQGGKNQKWMNQI